MPHQAVSGSTAPTVRRKKRSKTAVHQFENPFLEESHAETDGLQHAHGIT